MGCVLFKNAILIDGNGGEPRYPVSVLTDQNRIKEISDGDIRFTKADIKIDCRGNTLMPGLIDGHMHLGLVEIEVANLSKRNAPGLMAARMFRNMHYALNQGYTSARDLGGADIGFRQAQERGIMKGPKLQICGSAIAQTGGHGDDRLASEKRPYTEPCLGFRSTIADGVPDVLRAARENIRCGADFLKVMVGGGCASPAKGPDTSQYTLAELQAVVSVADSVGTYAAAHAYSNKSIALSLNAGIRTIEHGNFMTPETARLLAEKRAYYVPTQITYEIVIEKSRELISKFIYDKFVSVNESGYEAIKNAMQAGISIAGGSDLTGENTQYASGAISYQAKAQGALAAITSFTKVNAEMMGIINETGTLEEGKLADVLLVRGNPLENIDLFKNHLENLLVIMQEGGMHKNIIS